jgi:hypothetical protein
VRLDRSHRSGPGKIVIQGIADNSSVERRFCVELTEQDYKPALRTHQEGLRVSARGDLDIQGNYHWLRPLQSFSVLPGHEDNK